MMKTKFNVSGGLLRFEQVSETFWTAQIARIIPMSITPPSRAYQIYANATGRTLQAAFAAVILADESNRKEQARLNRKAQRERRQR